MPKPIFLIGVPFHEWDDEMVSSIQEDISQKCDDYHVLTHSHKGTDLTFRVIYEKDFDLMKYEELKAFVSESIKGKQ